MSACQLHDFGRGFVHRVRGREVHRAFLQQPLAFLDVGGGANAEQIRNAFKILMSDKNVKAVLINIFGGILRCDVLAQGVIAAVTDLGVRVPIVIRMEGTNVEEGKRLLRESGMNFTTADAMDDAATKVVQLAG